MNHNRFTPTRVILIIVLIGAVYKVGTLVNPPPVGPPAPPKVPAPAPVAANSPNQMSQKVMAQEMKDRIQKQMKQNSMALRKLALEMKLNNGKALPHDDGITPVYFQHTPMGTAGFAKSEQDAANTKRITDEVNKQMAGEMAKDLPSPPGSGGGITPGIPGSTKPSPMSPVVAPSPAPAQAPTHSQSGK